MKIGIFDFEVIRVEDRAPLKRIWFNPVLKIKGEIIQAYGFWKIEKDAYDAGIKKLEELFRCVLGQLTKPKYQIKSIPVDAVQWFPELKIVGIDSIGNRYYYKGKFIDLGDWIVDGKVVTNEEFERDYELI